MRCGYIDSRSSAKRKLDADNQTGHRLQRCQREELLTDADRGDGVLTAPHSEASLDRSYPSVK